MASSLAVQYRDSLFLLIGNVGLTKPIYLALEIAQVDQFPAGDSRLKPFPRSTFADGHSLLAFPRSDAALNQELLDLGPAIKPL